MKGRPQSWQSPKHQLYKRDFPHSPCVNIFCLQGKFLPTLSESTSCPYLDAPPQIRNALVLLPCVGYRRGLDQSQVLPVLLLSQESCSIISLIFYHTTSLLLSIIFFHSVYKHAQFILIHSFLNCKSLWILFKYSLGMTSVFLFPIFIIFNSFSCHCCLGSLIQNCLDMVIVNIFALFHSYKGMTSVFAVNIYQPSFAR